MKGWSYFSKCLRWNTPPKIFFWKKSFQQNLNCMSVISMTRYEYFCGNDILCCHYYRDKVSKPVIWAKTPAMITWLVFKQFVSNFGDKISFNMSMQWTRIFLIRQVVVSLFSHAVYILGVRIRISEYYKIY
jgi:hypothetical protein